MRPIRPGAFSTVAASYSHRLLHLFQPEGQTGMNMRLAPHRSRVISADSRQTVGRSAGLRHKITHFQYLRGFQAMRKFTYRFLSEHQQAGPSAPQPTQAQVAIVPRHSLAMSSFSAWRHFVKCLTDFFQCHTVSPFCEALRKAGEDVNGCYPTGQRSGVRRRQISPEPGVSFQIASGISI